MHKNYIISHITVIIRPFRAVMIQSNESILKLITGLRHRYAPRKDGSDVPEQISLIDLGRGKKMGRIENLSIAWISAHKYADLSLGLLLIPILFSKRSVTRKNLWQDHLTKIPFLCSLILNRIHAILQIKNRSSDISSKHYSEALKDANGEAISVCWLELVRGSPPKIKSGGGSGNVYHQFFNKKLIIFKVVR